MGNQNSRAEPGQRERSLSASQLTSASLPNGSHYYINGPFGHEHAARQMVSSEEREARRRKKEETLPLPAHTLTDFDPGQKIDGGFLTPRGTYTGKQDFYANVVAQFIVERRLAPFHRGLPDYENDWATDPNLLSVKILEQWKIPLPAERLAAEQQESLLPSHPVENETLTSNEPQVPGDEIRRGSKTKATLADVRARVRAHSLSHSPSSDYARRFPDSETSSVTTATHSLTLPDPARYIGAEECPICFLNYPAPLNTTRCCHQPICTECFVQIRRPDPEPSEEAPGGLISTPACCPYCVVPDFGVVHDLPPSRRPRQTSFHARPPIPEGSAVDEQWASPVGSPVALSKMPIGRRPSFPATSPEVVTTDAIRPDWSSKLRDARAAAIRKANRRFVARINQSGEYTYSVSRGDRAAGGQEFMTARQHLQNLEEQQLLEAMRLSQLDEEARMEREELDKSESLKRQQWEQSRAADEMGKTDIQVSRNTNISVSPSSDLSTSARAVPSAYAVLPSLASHSHASVAGMNSNNGSDSARYV